MLYRFRAANVLWWCICISMRRTRKCEEERYTHSQKGGSQNWSILFFSIDDKMKKRGQQWKKSWLIRFCHFESYFWIVLVCAPFAGRLFPKFHHYFQSVWQKKCIGNAFSLEALSWYTRKRPNNEHSNNSKWNDEQKKKCTTINSI